MGVHVVINTDSHDYEGFENLRFGVATAQRGWIEKDRVLMAKPVKELLGLSGEEIAQSALRVQFWKCTGECD